MPVTPSIRPPAWMMRGGMGESKPLSRLEELLAAGHTLVPVCPEVLGGLPTPRPPAETGAFVVGDISGVLGEDIAHDLVDRIISLFLKRLIHGTDAVMATAKAAGARGGTTIRARCPAGPYPGR